MNRKVRSIGYLEPKRKKLLCQKLLYLIAVIVPEILILDRVCTDVTLLSNTLTVY